MIVRELLTNTSNNYHTNVSKDIERASSIVFCNTAIVPHKINLVIKTVRDDSLKGAVYYGMDIDGGETIIIENIKIQPSEGVYAWADEGNVIAFNINI